MIAPMLLIAGGALLIVWVLMGRRKPVETGWAVRERCDGVYFVVMRGRTK